DKLLLNNLQWPSTIYVPLDETYLLDCSSWKRQQYTKEFSWKVYFNSGKIVILKNPVRLVGFQNTRDGYYECHSELVKRGVFIFSNAAQAINRTWTQTIYHERGTNVSVSCQPIYFNGGFNEEFIEIIDINKTIRFTTNSIIINGLESTTYLICKLYISTPVMGVRVRTTIPFGSDDHLTTSKPLHNLFLRAATPERFAHRIAFEGDTVYFRCPTETIDNRTNIEWKFLSWNSYEIKMIPTIYNQDAKISSVQIENSGLYSCLNNNDIKQQIILTVIDGPKAPDGIYDKTINIKYDSRYFICCNLNAYPYPTYSWEMTTGDEDTQPYVWCHKRCCWLLINYKDVICTSANRFGLAKYYIRFIVNDGGSTSSIINLNILPSSMTIRNADKSMPQNVFMSPNDVSKETSAEVDPSYIQRPDIVANTDQDSQPTTESKQNKTIHNTLLLDNQPIDDKLKVITSTIIEEAISTEQLLDDILLKRQDLKILVTPPETVIPDKAINWGIIQDEHRSIRPLFRASTSSTISSVVQREDVNELHEIIDNLYLKNEQQSSAATELLAATEPHFFEDMIQTKEEKSSSTVASIQNPTKTAAETFVLPEHVQNVNKIHKLLLSSTTTATSNTLQTVSQDWFTADIDKDKIYQENANWHKVHKIHNVQTSDNSIVTIPFENLEVSTSHEHEDIVKQETANDYSRILVRNKVQGPQQSDIISLHEFSKTLGQQNQKTTNTIPINMLELMNKVDSEQKKEKSLDREMYEHMVEYHVLRDENLKIAVDVKEELQYKYKH
ncbi:unnamed protein product, partial [Didymodactylos carnosus]